MIYCLKHTTLFQAEAAMALAMQQQVADAQRDAEALQAAVLFLIIIFSSSFTSKFVIILIFFMSICNYYYYCS
jgi:hypothetical protein